MKGFVRNIGAPLSIGFLLIIFAVESILSQSQALDGQIEGIVIDQQGAVIAGVSVKAVNVQTGAERTTYSNADGTFLFPILSLGSYSIIAVSPGFKTFEQNGITLSAGQTAPISVRMERGNIEETVTVTSDTAIADASKFEVGRVVNSRDAKNLPLISRNPYNFALLQPGVTGRAVKDPFAIVLNANGLRRRVGYQLDGGYNNDSNQGGVRLNLI